LLAVGPAPIWSSRPADAACGLCQVRRPGRHLAVGATSGGGPPAATWVRN